MKNKRINGVEIVSQSATGGRGRIRLRAPLTRDGIAAADPQLVERLKETGLASQWAFGLSQTKNDNFNFQRIEDVLPKGSDYITVKFRALSKTVVPGHWLDWTTGTVLEDSTAMLQGATVYPNHDFTDINNALGSVSRVAWDAEGAAAGGVPGINAEYKIDALMNPRIARLLLMDPPAIHSTSMTVLFEFDFSHPDLVEQGRFWDLLGEEVEGSIVRLIVTKVLEYWEASLVFQGADRLAKQYDDGDDGEEDDTDFADMSAKTEAEETTPPNSTEEKTMKLTKEQKAQLGIEFDGEDVPETEILKAAETLAASHAALTESTEAKAVADLTKRAEAGDTLVEAKRTEVTRLARLAELGAEDGTLDEVVTDQIAAADAAALLKLETYYGKRAADRFPAAGRSSEEDSDAAGAVSNDATVQMTADRTAGLLG